MTGFGFKGRKEYAVNGSESTTGSQMVNLFSLSFYYKNNSELFILHEGCSRISYNFLARNVPFEVQRTV